MVDSQSVENLGGESGFQLIDFCLFTFFHRFCRQVRFLRINQVPEAISCWRRSTHGLYDVVNFGTGSVGDSQDGRIPGCSELVTEWGSTHPLLLSHRPTSRMVSSCLKVRLCIRLQFNYFKGRRNYIQFPLTAQSLNLGSA